MKLSIYRVKCKRKIKKLWEENVMGEGLYRLLNRGFISLNSVNQLIFVMVKCGVLFEVRTEFLNIV
jgi:hypothetical protein